MNWLWWGAAASGWATAIASVLVLLGRQNRRETIQALRLRARVEPWLLRHAQELGMDSSDGAPPADAPLDEVVGSLCRLAEGLVARRKAQLSESDRMAVAQTMPIDRPPGVD